MHLASPRHPRRNAKRTRRWLFAVRRSILPFAITQPYTEHRAPLSESRLKSRRGLENVKRIVVKY